MEKRQQFAFGVDIGGTNIVCGLVHREGKVIWKRKVPTESHKGNEHVMRLVADSIQCGLLETGVAKDAVAGAGVGMPGLSDPVNGICIGSSNLKFENYPVAAAIHKLTGLTVWIDNDVRMYVYGEALYGAGRGARHVLGLTVGTGIAGAFIIDSQIYYGGGGMAGEIGHVPVEGNLRPCVCGLTGCLETIVSATGLAKQARDAVAAGESTMLSTMHEDPALLTARDVSVAFDMGDAEAIRILTYTGEILGRSLSYVVPMISPDVIVIGGGAALAGERLLSPARKALFDNVLPCYRECVKLVEAQLNDDAGVIGSAAVAFQKA